MRNTSADKENLMTNMAIPGEQDSDSEVKTNIFKSIAYARLHFFERFAACWICKYPNVSNLSFAGAGIPCRCEEPTAN